MHLRKDRPLPVRHRSLALAVALGLAGAPAVAFEALNFSTPGLAEDLRGQIKSFSALTAAKEAEEQAKLAEKNRLLTRVVEDEAARKAARDAKYAARKARQR